MKKQKTFSLKPADVNRKWFIVDASKAPVGRISTQVAQLLLGKGKAEFTPHVDSGDFVVVVNADQAQFSGQKETDKVYYRHTGYPGGIKQRTVAEQRDIDATKLIEKAVYGMLPDNKLRDGRMKRLKIYAGSDHNHAAQKPEEVNVGEAK